jgi:hypothetical protein
MKAYNSVAGKANHKACAQAAWPEAVSSSATKAPHNNQTAKYQISWRGRDKIGCSIAVVV